MSATIVKADIAVVGAGPAGLAAATFAARAGASVVVVDAYARAGGQYFVQGQADAPPSRQAKEGQDAIARATAAGVRLLTGTEVFAAYPGFQLFASGPEGQTRIAARAVIAATGAHDRTVAFPGWTLPGVMTAGGGQRLAKEHGQLPGKRIVLSGSGIFLYAVAETLIDKGAEIVALVEARRPSAALLWHLARFPERWGEAYRLLARVRRDVLRRINGHLVTAALGNDRVEAVRLARLDGSGAFEIGGIDCLLTSYGFQPQLEITSLLGCAHEFDDALGGWLATADRATGATTTAGVFAAGEVTGIAGARPARLSGELAGLSAARSLGLRISLDETAPLVRELARARAFGHGLGRLFAPLPQLGGLADDSTLVCRCEEVTLAEVRAAASDAASSFYGAKIWTRVGMGRCQGRMCRMPVTLALAGATGASAEAIGYNRPRIPTRPVRLDYVLEALSADSGHSRASTAPKDLDG